MSSSSSSSRSRSRNLAEAMKTAPRMVGDFNAGDDFVTWAGRFEMLLGYFNLSDEQMFPIAVSCFKAPGFIDGFVSSCSGNSKSWKGFKAYVLKLTVSSEDPDALVREFTSQCYRQANENVPAYVVRFNLALSRLSGLLGSFPEGKEHLPSVYSLTNTFIVGLGHSNLEADVRKQLQLADSGSVAADPGSSESSQDRLGRAQKFAQEQTRHQRVRDRVLPGKSLPVDHTSLNGAASLSAAARMRVSFSLPSNRLGGLAHAMEQEEKDALGVAKASAKKRSQPNLAKQFKGKAVALTREKFDQLEEARRQADSQLKDDRSVRAARRAKYKRRHAESSSSSSDSEDDVKVSDLARSRKKKARATDTLATTVAQLCSVVQRFAPSSAPPAAPVAPPSAPALSVPPAAAPPLNPCIRCGSFSHPTRSCPASDPRRCYGCNQFGHVVRNCPARQSQIRCYKCGQAGHKSNNPACPQFRQGPSTPRGSYRGQGRGTTPAPKSPAMPLASAMSQDRQAELAALKDQVSSLQSRLAKCGQESDKKGNS